MLEVILCITLPPDSLFSIYVLFIVNQTGWIKGHSSKKGQDNFTVVSTLKICYSQNT